MAERTVEGENIELDRIRTLWRISGSSWGSSIDQILEGWRFDNLGTSDDMLAKFGGSWKPTPSMGDDASGYYHQAWMFGQFNREDIWKRFAESGQLRLEARVGPVIYLTAGNPRRCEGSAGMYSGTSTGDKKYDAPVVVPEFLGGSDEPGARRGIIYETGFSYPPLIGTPQLPLPVPDESWKADFDPVTEWPIGERAASGAIGRLSPVHALGVINFAEGFFRGWRFDDERSEENWKFWNANYFNDIFGGPNFVTPEGAESPLGPRSLIMWWLMWNYIADKPLPLPEMRNDLIKRAKTGEFTGLTFTAKSKCQLRVIYLKGDGSEDPPEPTIGNTVVGNPITFIREQVFTLGAFHIQVGGSSSGIWFDIDHNPITDFNYLDDPKVSKTDGAAFDLGMPSGCHGVAGVIYSIWDEDKWVNADVDPSRTLIDPRSRYGGLAPHELRFNFGLGGKGKPITVPGGAIQGTGAAAGSKPHHRPTRGNVA